MSTWGGLTKKTSYFQIWKLIEFRGEEMLLTELKVQLQNAGNKIIAAAYSKWGKGEIPRKMFTSAQIIILRWSKSSHLNHEWFSIASKSSKQRSKAVFTTNIKGILFDIGSRALKYVESLGLFWEIRSNLT